jgi:omega-hydroxy-beta-dihydromenaquinone-9 sulfotransferase
MELCPLATGSLINWLRLLIANGGVEPAHLPKALVVTSISLTGSLGRVIERLAYDSMLAKTSLKKPPIFVIGHWRSGTTFLHNLISQDPNLAYASCHQVLAPELFMGSGYITKPLMACLMPEKRPMDNMLLDLNAPQEEELALSCMSPYSFYNGWFFPRRMQSHFTRYVLFEDVSPRVQEDWKSIYLKFLKKVSLASDHRQLLLKNPTNTARIRLLLELFPDAKFIHIYRNPYIVYLSTQNLYRKFLSAYGFQTLSEAEIEANVFWIYRQLMQRFLAERSFIPASNLVEVKYEDLEVDPMRELARIYDDLNLPNFAEVSPRFQHYLNHQTSYRKNQYRLEPEMLKAIYQAWQFTIDLWQYQPPNQIELVQMQ